MFYTYCVLNRFWIFLVVNKYRNKFHDFDSRNKDKNSNFYIVDSDLHIRNL